jgi:hypothetical protein
LPDYYQTFFRNYDQALGRFVAIDPMAEAAESLTGYNYSGNNPIMFNDPMGDAERKTPFAIPLELPPLGGSGSGGGPLGNGRGNFVLDAFERQRAAEELKERAREGDPEALAEYVRQTGGVTYVRNPDYLKDIKTVGNVTYFDNDRFIREGNQGSGCCETKDWTTKAVGIGLTLSKADGPLLFGDAIGAAVITVAAIRDLSQKKYITYTMKNAAGKIYVGRTSG